MSNEHITDEQVAELWRTFAGTNEVLRIERRNFKHVLGAILKGIAMRPAAQPVGEPVASIYISPNGDREFDDWKCALPVGRNILYAAPHPVAAPDRVPMSREDLKAFMDESGYGHVTAQEKADFINGFRSAEAHHRITPPSNQPTRTE